MGGLIQNMSFGNFAYAPSGRPAWWASRAAIDS